MNKSPGSPVVLLLILGGTLAGGFAAEMALRLAGIAYPEFYVADGIRGWALRPGASGSYREEGQTHVRINSDGWRDREHTRQKPPNTLRIAVLGDSFTEAMQVPTDQTFWAVMERELGGCRPLRGRKVESINFGVNGYGTAQEFLTLRHHVWQYSPDIVVLALCTGNDLWNNSKVLGDTARRPYFVSHDGALVLDDSFLGSPAFVLRSWAWDLVHYSRVAQLLNRVRRVIIARRLRASSQKQFAFHGLLGPIALEEDASLYSEPRDPALREAWGVTEELLVMMRNEVRQKGADFLVVTLTNPVQVCPEPRVRREFIEATGVQNLFYPDRRIKALGEREGFKVLNLAQPFQAYADQHHVFLHGFDNTAPGTGHWNTEGHRLAGKLIAQELCESVK